MFISVNSNELIDFFAVHFFWTAVYFSLIHGRLFIKLSMVNTHGCVYVKENISMFTTEPF